MTTETRRIELYEDNAGGLWFVLEHEARAIEMSENGDFLTDARLYGDTWGPVDCPELSVHRLADVQALIDDQQTTHVATYREDTDALVIHQDESRMGHAAREYLRASLDPVED